MTCCNLPFHYNPTIIMRLAIIRTVGLFISLVTHQAVSQVIDVNRADSSDVPRNVILLVGDGMGLSQVSASFYYGEETPNFERFPVIGLIKTSSASDKITDSAAGATAFSAGVSTYNGAIGVDTAKQAVPTLVEILSAEGMSTGLVATSSITHATPRFVFCAR